MFQFNTVNLMDSFYKSKKCIAKLLKWFLNMIYLFYNVYDVLLGLYAPKNIL